MKCTRCEVEIESDDNFCWNCGHWTAKGYTFLKDEQNVKKIANGDAVKQDMRLTSLFVITGITVSLFVGGMILKGNDIFKPIFFLKRSFDSYIYGYNTSMIKTENVYENKLINNIVEARDMINQDLKNQEWKCSHDINTYVLETKIETDYDIPSVNFCDISYDEAQKIKSVIDEIYYLFPKVRGSLTNITVTNAKTQSEYIAYFQPMFQFVNPNSDIESFNKVNKTQILLNSYYYLNDEILSKEVSEIVGSGWYPEDATWESAIAHEMGHYITFKALLKSRGLENITLVTKENYAKIEEILKEFEEGSFIHSLLEEARNNYNAKYGTDYDLESLSLNISKYAVAKDSDGHVIEAETIAEAIHDYYLHKSQAKEFSLEIVKVLMSRM